MNFKINKSVLNKYERATKKSDWFMRNHYFNTLCDKIENGTATFQERMEYWQMKGKKPKPFDKRYRRYDNDNR